MPFRLTPVLFAILLAACASPGPAEVSYTAPAGEDMTVPALPPAIQPAAEPVSGLPPYTPGTPPLAAPQGVRAQAAYDQPSPDEDVPAGVTLPPGATNCSTVDGVTLCDAPFDPAVDAARYTN